ncbi:MAG: hemerythrin family protein [Coriobacteriia bacterium]|nr:hemerythrin family protein [Coriobacteriia bacterium]MBN2840476.1 hemerythrin family protein [Coriobacteriia bacterium]
MSTFEWTPDLVTGNELIDSQHHTLFRYANDLLDAIEDAEVDDEAAEVYVWRLTDYVMEHFADEQDLMESVHYPERGIHVGMHDTLTGETMRLTARVMRGEIVAAPEIAKLITKWMREHILTADKQFVTYLSAQQ